MARVTREEMERSVAFGPKGATGSDRSGHEDMAGDAEFAERMHLLGATSPATACAGRDLPHLSRHRFQDLLDRGILREGAPGTFYLYANSVTKRAAIPLTGPTPTPSVIIRLLFWLLVILVPVIIIQSVN